MWHMDATPASIASLASCSFHAAGYMSLDMTCWGTYINTWTCCCTSNCWAIDSPLYTCILIAWSQNAQWCHRPYWWCHPIRVQPWTNADQQVQIAGLVNSRLQGFLAANARIRVPTIWFYAYKCKPGTSKCWSGRIYSVRTMSFAMQHHDWCQLWLCRLHMLSMKLLQSLSYSFRNWHDKQEFQDGMCVTSKPV